ncbi:MAG: thioredoxin [Dehalococcoidia bacterium]|jgi:thioredoxin 1|nr:thioredoxin [Chloroflexota bacterium]MDP6056235.1 thioredoxin [Dehalococcoidia bacterium]MDP7261495.1 thioredoxin [Dehalococcoidia bacterium]MDP7485163.1 thioredoxin [Dehalococcoidia bacterium]|tara:strand:- start:19 stop:348 length:330 start_codon:yes stop_codon:yes gene_type:complete
MTKPQDVNDAEFSTEVIDSELPVLVDFWAEWCGPCKQIAPVVEELANEYDGKAKFVKLNVDTNPQTSAKYGVRSIPTLLIFKGGAPVGQVVGAVPKSVLQARLEDAMTV